MRCGNASHGGSDPVDSVVNTLGLLSPATRSLDIGVTPLTKRELSEKLCEIACVLDELSEGDQSNVQYRRRLMEVADELHDLSNENFTPGSTSWHDIKQQANKPTKKPRYLNAHGRELPF